MKPQEMAESMRTLRIAANFQRSPRPSPRTTTATNGATTNPSFATDWAAAGSTKNNFQRLLRDQQVTVESSEMARIASIFSSKK